MTESPSSPPVRFADAEEPVTEYRSIHWVAVVALLLGLVSATALISPLLAIVPVVAAMLAVFAIRSIRANPDQWIGLTAALIGLALATFFFGWGVSKGLIRSQRIERQAIALANDWLALVQQGKLQEAHQWWLSGNLRATPSEPLDKFYHLGPDQENALREFSDKPLVDALRDAGESANPRFVEITRHTSNGPDDEMIFRYTMADAANSEERRSFWLTVAWYYDEVVGKYFWQVRAIEPTPPKNL